MLFRSKWFSKLVTKATAFCFTNHRIQFENFDGKASSVNTRGQVFAYFGRDINLFKREFEQYGHIMIVIEKLFVEKYNPKRKEMK